MAQPNRFNTTSAWWKLGKILLLLFALFITIVLFNYELSKRREAQAAAAAAIAANAQLSKQLHTTALVSDDLMNYMLNRAQGAKPAGSAGSTEQPQQHQRRQEPDNQTELSAEKIEDRIRSTFVMREGKGVWLFGPTKPSPLSHVEPTALQDQQAFKVQRSPDGKLNLVFNDPIVSLQPNAASPSNKPRQPSSNAKEHSLPECADGHNSSSSLCTKVHNYPDLSGLSGLLKREFASFFTDETEPTELGTRIDTGEQYLCKSNVKYLYPQLGRAADNTQQYIVNTGEFKQAILVEECDKEGERCEFMNSLANNYVPICKQHYISRQMVTINNGTGVKPLEVKPILIPSCCKCVIKDKSSDGDNYS